MKERKNKQWVLMLVSLLCAFLVWLAAVNVADPVITETVEIPIEIINDEILEKNGLTYETVGRRTATVAYEVTTTNAYRIRSSDFRAFADMTELWSVTGSIPVQVDVLNHSEYLVSSPVSRTSTIKIKTEPIQEKQFVIASSTKGAMPDGYEPGEVSVSPGYLTVRGPESLIGQISSVGIEVDVEGMTTDTAGTAIPQYYNANGNVIELSDRITSNCVAVEYNLTVLRVKNVNLDFEVAGQAADGYRFTGVECQTSSVPVVGLKSVLAGIQNITIPGDRLNLAGAAQNVTVSVDLNDYLPEGVELAIIENHMLQVTLLVEALETRNYQVEVNDASFAGEREEFFYRASPGEVTVTVRALSEELDSLKLDSADLHVDVSSMEEGAHVALPTLSEALDPAYELVGITSCTINVRRYPGEPGGTIAGPGSNPSDSQSSSASGEQTQGEAEASSHAEAQSQAPGQESDVAREENSQNRMAGL